MPLMMSEEGCENDEGDYHTLPRARAARRGRRPERALCGGWQSLCARLVTRCAWFLCTEGTGKGLTAPLPTAFCTRSRKTPLRDLTETAAQARQCRFERDGEPHSLFCDMFQCLKDGGNLWFRQGGMQCTCSLVPVSTFITVPFSAACNSPPIPKGRRGPAECSPIPPCLCMLLSSQALAWGELPRLTTREESRRTPVSELAVLEGSGRGAGPYQLCSLCLHSWYVDARCMSGTLCRSLAVLPALGTGRTRLQLTDAVATWAESVKQVTASTGFLLTKVRSQCLGYDRALTSLCPEEECK